MAAQSIFLLSIFLYISIQPSNADPSHILPCFQAYPAGTVQPITTIYGTSLYDCLMTCLQWAQGYKEQCSSVLWDDYQHTCYLFSQRASQNPGLLLNRYGTTYYEKIGYSCGGASTPPGPGPVTSQPPSATSCPTKPSTAYFTVAEAELATPSDTATTTLSEVPAENACISSCTDEQGPGGASLPCSGLTALPKASKCVVATTRAQPTGPGVLSPNPDAVYFEKFCLPPTAPPDCFEQFFFLFPGKILTGSDLSSTSATSLSDCAGKCIQQTPQCQAAVYDSTASTCTLKSGSAITNPTAFTNGPETSYYFENGCLIPQNRTGAGAGGLPGPEAGAGAGGLPGPAGAGPGALPSPAGAGAGPSPGPTDTGAGAAPTGIGGSGGSPLGGGLTAGSGTSVGGIGGGSGISLGGLGKARERALANFRARVRLLALKETSENKSSSLAVLAGKSKSSLGNSSKTETGGSGGSVATWGLWSACQFQVGSRRARVRVRNCASLTKCPDKDIEFDYCST